MSKCPNERILKLYAVTVLEYGFRRSPELEAEHDNKEESSRAGTW